MTNPNSIPSLSLAVAMYRDGTAALAAVAYAAITNRLNYRDMWHLLNSLQVAVNGLDWETHKQEVCDATKAAQSEARAIIRAEKAAAQAEAVAAVAAAKARSKAPAMVDRIMAKYSGA